jgi:Fe2+ or Zn2+ uptake regulation protein
MVARANGRAATILDQLTAQGGRRTVARQAIIEAIVESGTHLTADDIARRVQQRFPSVNISTVYRTLDSLEAIGVIDHVHLGHGRAIYHLTDEVHQHLVCERCERVLELPASKLGGFISMLDRDFGFEVDSGHFAIVGTCRSCRRKSSKA